MKNQPQSTTGKLRLYKKIYCYENYLELPFYLRNPLIKLRINYELELVDLIYRFCQSTNTIIFLVITRLKMSYTFCLTVIPIMICKNIVT